MKNSISLLFIILILSLGCLGTTKSRSPAGGEYWEDRFMQTQERVLTEEAMIMPAMEAPISDLKLGAEPSGALERTFEPSPSEAESGVDPVLVDSGEKFEEGQEDVTGIKIIYSGDIEIEVENFDSAYSQAKTLVGSYGGYVSDTNVYMTPAGKKRGVITVRVPKDKYDAIIEDISSLGTVKTLRTEAQDVTLEYTDLDSRLNSLQMQETRLLELLERAENITEILDIEKELERIRGEIERIQGRLKYLDNKIDYSTITITLREPEPVVGKPVTLNADADVKSIDIALDQLDKLAKDAGGYIFNAWVDESDPTQKKAGVQIDIPQTQYLELEGKLNDIGEIENKRLEGFPSEDAPPASRATINLKMSEKTSLLKQVVGKDYGLKTSIIWSVDGFMETITTLIEAIGYLLPIVILAFIGYVLLKRFAGENFKRYLMLYLILLSLLTLPSGGWVLLILLIGHLLVRTAQGLTVHLPGRGKKS